MITMPQKTLKLNCGSQVPVILVYKVNNEEMIGRATSTVGFSFTLEYVVGTKASHSGGDAYSSHYPDNTTELDSVPLLQRDSRGDSYPSAVGIKRRLVVRKS